VSEDGTGGVVYTKRVEGAAHVFAAQYADGRWLAPVRVDWQSPYAASDPRIGAADGGELVVVWVTQIATVGGKVQDALMASTLGPGASSFGPQYVVDSNVGEGVGVSPSLAIASNGQGLVAYRVVHNLAETSLGMLNTLPSLHPGDVFADIRVARYDGARWSVLPRINRDALLTMRPPSETNGPLVGVGRSDEAVVAWQEPEANGVARIWARRIFGTTLGLVLPASPATYAGTQVTAEATALGLSVSPFGEAEVLSTVTGEPDTSPTTALLFANTLPGSTAPSGAQFNGPIRVAAAGGEIGPPSVAVDDLGNFRIAFAASSEAQILTGTERGGVTAEVPLGPAVAATGPGAVTALDPNGGGVTAWPAAGGGVGVREDFPDGAAQAAQISGTQGGSVSGLTAGGSESGEALVGFREGEPGAYEIVGERVSVPPPPFDLEVPKTWVAPDAALIAWTDAEDASGGVTYSLVLDGHVVIRGIHGHSVLPDRRLLGGGVQTVQMIATDASGQQTLSNEAELKVAAEPPVASVHRDGGRTVTVRVSDHQAGALARATRIAFGDGVHVNGKLTARHTYAKAGRYVIVVQMRDRVGNEATAHLRVSVR
jgi:hypothetical protein